MDAAARQVGIALAPRQAARQATLVPTVWARPGDATRRRGGSVNPTASPVLASVALAIPSERRG